MKKYEIPDELIPGFDILIKIQEKDLTKIINAIKSIPVGTTSKPFIKAIENSLDFENKESLGRTIHSFGELLSRSDSGSIDELAKDVSNSLNEVKKEKLSKEQTISLEQNLKSIFSNCDNLKKTYKALALLGDNDKIFDESRVITDIRLVFNDNISDKDRNAVIFHKLKIEFISSHRRETFFVSLDKYDLKKLQDNIARALNKEEIIKKEYSSVNFIELTI